VVYHLEGGERAQQFFRREQLAQAEKLGLNFTFDPASKTGLPSACEFHRPNIVRVADADKFWLVTPFPAITDYVSTFHSQSPKKVSPRKAKPLVQPSPGSNGSESKVADPSSQSITFPLSRDEDIDQMLLDTIASHAAKLQHFQGSSLPQEIAQSAPSPRSSSSDSPVWCQGCGMQEPDSDDDPDEVQCQRCKLWAHINCLAADMDWDNPEVDFICTRCYDPLVDL
jgi:hypothetical protein